MTLIGVTHTVFATAALGLGLAVVLRPKGTQAHRYLGRCYVLTMLVVNITALMIYRLFGRWGPFHWAAVMSLLTLSAGLIPVLFRRPAGSWLETHYRFMSWSYAGLLAATASEAAVHLPIILPLSRWTGLPPTAAFGAAVAGATVLVIVIGAWMIERRGAPFARRFDAVSRRSTTDGTGRD